MQDSPKFKLDSDFILKYKDRKAKFGFNALGEVAYKRSYARVKDNGKSECWSETVERVVNGTYNMQKNYLESQSLPFDWAIAQESAQIMYEKIFSFKFLPPGRGLWAMGTKITEQKKIFAALNNCAFVSTLPSTQEEASKPFLFLMDSSMLGVGVGFDTKAANKIEVHPNTSEQWTFLIPDSREGWVESMRHLLDSYFIKGSPAVTLDYSAIRPEGILLKGFGGISSGPEPLRFLHENARRVLQDKAGSFLTTRAIVDIMNMIGKCIVSGNIRRTAEIAFGDPDDEEFLNLKNYERNPERAEYGWTSNNSIFAKIGMDYTQPCENIRYNGEPGFCWLDNMRKYGRMCDPPNFKDHKAMGGNPCLEQTLESFEMCCLVETFPYNHDSYEEFEETLKYAYSYAKTVTLGLSHWKETNEVIERNRRIGCSMSGIVQFISKYDLHTLKDWCNRGYKFLEEEDAYLSDKFNVSKSIKMTSIKPSGTVSLLAGATPGVHYPQSQFYIRRIRISARDELVEPLKRAGYHIEADAYSKDKNSQVAEIPVSIGKNVRTLKDVSMWEQLHLAAFMQEHWADNQVSCTITFDPETEGSQISTALDFFQYKLKGISFLPRLDANNTVYKQMPYEEITEEQYLQIHSRISRFNLTENKKDYTPIDPNVALFCDGDTCHFSK
jgi:ribonucleoside-triphosphate reductase (thioredoxin)